MINYKRTQIFPGITLIQEDDTCIYLVEGKNQAVVIDTGYGLNNLGEEIKKITGKPPLVFITHGHLDHAFGAHYFDRVYMSREDVPVYELHKEIRVLRKEIIGNSFGASEEDLDRWVGAVPEKIEFTSEGDSYDTGDNTFEVVSLKGHTPGSIGFIDIKNRILFSGDGVINHVWLQLPESSSVADYIKTLDSLNTHRSKFDFILAGHRGTRIPVSFLDKLRGTLTDLINGAWGKPYVNPVASGMIYKRKGCEVIYNPERIK